MKRDKHETGTGVPEATGASSIEAHPRWPEVLAFLRLEPGDNGVMTKALRNLRRAEQESREAGNGPELVGREIARLAREVEDLARATIPCRACRRPADPDLVRRRNECEDLLASRRGELQSRDARIVAIAKTQKEAHVGAVASIHSALRARMAALAHSALLVVKMAPPAALSNPQRLPDDLVEICRQVELGHGLALAFSSTAPGETASAADFWSGLNEDCRVLIEAKLLAPRPSIAAA